ncbi:uncharacterized protein LOC129248147 [Anastrepha obliqua]|uniref:uncharacterized protein LOC129248147 n=1 Tax=Anastrepha obliqua TaxID=95512 RepID=UPI00240A1B9D|nr:uncharacterized protein LOC129248147 [Anastrepha obliqua]
MKMRKSKSREVLLEHGENVPIENDDTMLPAELCAATSLLHDNSNNTSANTDDSVSIQIKPVTLLSEAQKDELGMVVPLTAEKANISPTNTANERSIFKSPPLPWYRNWTSAGIVLCVVYNLTIMFLLVMGVFKFGKG